MTTRLLQFTDPHLYGAADGKLRGVVTYPALLAALEHARAHHWPCDAILATGDLVQDDPSGYARFREVFAPLGVPVHCIAGNHDEPEAMRRELDIAPFQLGGVAHWPGWIAVMLDSYLAGKAQGRIDAANLALLDDALRSHPKAHALVCLHHHPVQMHSRWLDQVGLENPDEFFDVLDAHRNVRAVLWGHVHQHFEGERQGVRLMSTPSTCAQFLPRSEGFAIDRRPPGFRWLELREDGTIATDVVWVPDFPGKPA
ncbi:MAG TPA: metallophosphoesterase [Steroidobacteraceae bacterium]|nr:metallophosphoesterase [Steroidobacteraceae bacterium]